MSDDAATPRAESVSRWKPLSDEQWRILDAAHDRCLSFTESGRWVIAGGPRPNRREREKLQQRGLLEWENHYDRSTGSWAGSRLVPTLKGLLVIAERP